MRKWDRERYESIAVQSSGHDGTIRAEEFAQLLISKVVEQHRAISEGARLHEFEHGPATYLFAERTASHDDRTLLAIGTPEPPKNEREHAYQRATRSRTSSADDQLTGGTSSRTPREACSAPTSFDRIVR